MKRFWRIPEPKEHAKLARERNKRPEGLLKNLVTGSKNKITTDNGKPRERMWRL